MGVGFRYYGRFTIIIAVLIIKGLYYYGVYRGPLTIAKSQISALETLNPKIP